MTEEKTMIPDKCPTCGGGYWDKSWYYGGTCGDMWHIHIKIPERYKVKTA